MLLSSVDCTSVIIGLTFGTMGSVGIFFLTTRSFEEDAIIGNNSVIFRETIEIASNVAIVFTMFVRVLKNLPRVSQSLGKNFCKK